MDDNANSKTFVRLGRTLQVGSVRINHKCDVCGRPFMASDVDLDNESIVRVTCGGCHDRPLEIELIEGQDVEDLSS